MAKQPHRQLPGFALAISLALLPWLGCSPSESGPTDLDGGVTGAGGTQTGGTQAGGSTGAAGHAGTSGTIDGGGAGGAGGSIGAGTAGATGPAGTTGAAGNRGTAGASPTTGTAGTTGAAGHAGTTGAGGASPTAGTTGATGAAGHAGTTGTAGTSGVAGTTGATGAAGHAGTTGGSGVTGVAGTTGIAGIAGTTGTTGAAGTTGTTGGGGSTTATAGKIKNVFVIAMENEPASAIYGDKRAPYLNGLLSKYARATAFTDPLPDSIPSEPHYVWMEAGTNKFSDVTFTDDGDPSAGNSTKNTAHLTTQMNAASPPISWMGAMEGLNSSTGAYPTSSSGFYAAKHDPFVFFQDVAGSPPSKSNALCGAHHQAFTTGQALVAGAVAQYTFISPNVCNDMHGDSSCPSGDPIAMGDAWLAANLPPLIDYANAHAGVIFIVWDEPEGGSPVMPFFAIGPSVKPGYTSTVTFTHSSLLKTVEEIFGLPVLPTVAGATDFADLFLPGTLP